MSRNFDIGIGIISLGVALIAFADAASEVGSPKMKLLAATAGTLAFAGGILAIGSGLNKPSCG